MELKKKIIFSLLGDIVDTVRGLLCEKMIKSKKNYDRIEWFTSERLIRKIIISSLVKNNFFIEKHI